MVTGTVRHSTATRPIVVPPVHRFNSFSLGLHQMHTARNLIGAGKQSKMTMTVNAVRGPCGRTLLNHGCENGCGSHILLRRCYYFSRRLAGRLLRPNWPWPCRITKWPQKPLRGGAARADLCRRSDAVILCEAMAGPFLYKKETATQPGAAGIRTYSILDSKLKTNTLPYMQSGWSRSVYRVCILSVCRIRPYLYIGLSTVNFSYFVHFVGLVFGTKHF
jgi:hypothetical protein